MARCHGRGVLACDADASCRYDGEWARDTKHGRGTFVYASGNRYDGEWANDRKHGLGRMSWLDRGEAYDGEWRDGLPHGRGTHRWDRRGEVEDGAWFTTRNAYEGDFVEGEEHTAPSPMPQAATPPIRNDENIKAGSYTLEDDLFSGEALNDRCDPPTARRSRPRRTSAWTWRRSPRPARVRRGEDRTWRCAQRGLHRLATARAATKTNDMPRTRRRRPRRSRGFWR